MAFPVVEQVVENAVETTAVTNHTVNLPTATAGHLLIIIGDIGSTAASVNAHASLTELLDEGVANGLYIAYRQMDGTEPASYTLVTSAATRFVTMAYRISGAANPATQAPQIGTTGTGTSATPDPPASATPGSAKDYLFIAFYGAAGEEADDDTWSDTPPTNYTPSPPRQKTCGTVGTNLGGLIAAAERQLNTGSAEDPGTFAKDVSAAWRAQTIMVHPAPPSINAEPGSYTYTGSAATLLFGPAINASAGAYTLTGFDATLTQAGAGAEMNAEPGSYAVTGAAAELLHGFALNAEPGAYVVTGAAATLLLAAVMNAAPGAYVLTGADAILLLNEEPGGGVIWMHPLYWGSISNVVD